MFKKISVPIVLLISILSFSQERRVIGKVTSNSRELEGITIFNQNTQEYFETENGGYFSVKAKIGDLLIFSSISLIGTKHKVVKENFSKKLVFIPMKLNETILDEIFIDNSVNSRSLGFGNPIIYTPVQRNLITATSSGGGILAIDAVANKLSGRTKMLERAVKIEKELLAVQEFLNNFTSEYLATFLKLKTEEIQAFGFFAYNDKEIQKHLYSVNQNYLNFLMSEKVTKFKQQ